MLAFVVMALLFNLFRLCEPFLPRVANLPLTSLVLLLSLSTLFRALAILLSSLPVLALSSTVLVNSAIVCSYYSYFNYAMSWFIGLWCSPLGLPSLSNKPVSISCCLRRSEVFSQSTAELAPRFFFFFGSSGSLNDSCG